MAYIRFVSLKHSVCGKEINLFQELSTRMSQLSQSRQSRCVGNGDLAANLDSNNRKIVVLILFFSDWGHIQIKNKTEWSR